MPHELHHVAHAGVVAVAFVRVVPLVSHEPVQATVEVRGSCPYGVAVDQHLCTTLVLELQQHEGMDGLNRMSMVRVD